MRGQSVNGAQVFRSSGAVRFLLDGADASRVDFEDLNNTYGASRGRVSRASIDQIAEFRLYTNSFSAEFGQSLGGVVNVITKSGTNEFHGGLFEYFRNEKLDARNYFNHPPSPQPPFRLNQFGGSLGGPIVANKLFFFGNYEAVRQRTGETQSVFVPTAAFRDTVAPEVRPAVDMLPLPNGEISASDPRLGRFTEGTSDILDENSGSGKVDYNVGNNDRLYVRYNLNGNTTKDDFGVAEGQSRTALGLPVGEAELHTRLLAELPQRVRLRFQPRAHRSALRGNGRDPGVPDHVFGKRLGGSRPRALRSQGRE